MRRDQSGALLLSDRYLLSLGSAAVLGSTAAALLLSAVERICGLSSKTRVFLAGLALVALLGEAGSSPSAAYPSGGDSLVSGQPAAAAAFIASQRDRDVIAASLVTSPLYRVEMERRGSGTDWPLDGLWTEATSYLSFTFVAALSDSSGFTYALYSARAKHPHSDSPTSLWRIDLDPEGKVIWAELARVFDSPEVELVRGTQAVGPADQRWRFLLAVRSAAGDAYVALDPDPKGPGRVASAQRIAFAQMDSSGTLEPSYWSFGLPTPTRDAELHSIDPHPFDLDSLTDGQAQTLRSYLGVVDWSPADSASAR